MDRRDLWSSASTGNRVGSQTPKHKRIFISFCWVSQLPQFEASNNKLEGEIPAEIGNLLKFQILNIAKNHLKGQLPASIWNLSALQEINVNGNRLSGRIPSTRSHVYDLASEFLVLCFILGVSFWFLLCSNSTMKMRALLVHQGLESALEEEDPETAGSSRSDEKIKQIHNRAQCTLILSLSDSILREISEEKIALGILNEMEPLCMKKSLAHRLFLKKMLYTFFMKKGVSIYEHIDVFNKIILDLK
ncbi:hypothetical protein WN943_023305 [Citrus x changshan-huyou]